MYKDIQRPLIASLALALVVAIVAPTEVYLANIHEMSYGLNYHGQDAIGVFFIVAAGLGALVALVFMLNRRLLRPLELVIVVVLVVFLLNRNLLYGDYGAFDGRGLTIAPVSLLSLVQLTAVVLLIILLWRIPRLAAVLIPVAGCYALISLGIAANNFYSSGAHWKILLKHPSPLGKSYFQFSRDEPNYLYILVDEVYGGSTREILETDPDLAASFTGFTFYPDTAGVYPTTIVSVPAILSGELYRNGEPVKDYLSRAFSDSPLLRLLETERLPAFIHSSGMYCNYLDRKTCSDMGDMLPSRDAAASEYGEIIDVTLFSMLPDVLKPLLYNDGNWTFRNLIGPLGDYSSGNFQVQEFRFFVEAIKARKSGGSFKLYHNTVTHSPVRLNRNCELMSANLSPNYENYLQQDRCGFQLLESLLDKLRELDIYDNTFIVISSDHGRPFLKSELQERFDTSTGQASYKQYGYAHATLLVKPLQASHKLTISTEPASLLDISHYFTRAIQGSGIALARPHSSGERQFHYYDWSKKYFDWKQSELPPFQAVYLIEPEITNPESWRENPHIMQSVLRDELRTPLPCGLELNLGDPANNAYYLSDGLAGVESWGRWSDGGMVRIHFLGGEATCSKNRIALDLKAFLGKRRPSQTAEVFFNGTRLGDIKFHRDGSKHQSIELFFQASNYNNDDINTIEFRIQDPVSPARLGINDDTRNLAIGIKSITVH